MPKQYSTERPRLIYPAAATSRKLARCCIEAQLLFTRLIAAADDQGRLQGDAALVKAACMPLVAKATRGSIQRWLKELEAQGLVICYEAAEEPLIQMKGWWGHQGGQRWIYPSRWLPPADWQDVEPKTPSQSTGGDAGVTPTSRRPDADIAPASQGEGQESVTGGANGGAVAAASTFSPMKENLYEAYITLSGLLCDTKATKWIDDLVKQFDRDTVRRAMYSVPEPRGSLLGQVTNRLRNSGPP
jgi:hypothetical protein